ncbi:carboxypeptidase-like regulatory domain-containing protein [Marinobacter sediminum]|uniref:carboxypeptidase-like regulatory domain-containing protein n=1 Tax=Marinobacter sediminum TaxID=256323 RepID=UPI0019396627|nr:carboxypeptidase-like regulatory domain-containing protein [Marinobacter sediminum]
MVKRKAQVLFVLMLLGPLFSANTLAQTEAAASREFLLLEVRLDHLILSEAFPAYGDSRHTFLPLGSLAQLLTLGIEVSPETGTANGFAVSPDHRFGLDALRGRVSYGPITEDFDADSMVIVEPDDIYVATTLLERWFPIQLDVNYARLRLTVTASVLLPLQAKLDRLRRQSDRPAGAQPLFFDYPKLAPSYQLASVPFVDQTFSTQVLNQADQKVISNRYSAFLTSDLFYMESAFRITSDREDPTPDIRATLSRYHPDGELLGPLSATSVVLGNYGSFSNDNINRAASGNGVTISNRSLTAASGFDQQTLEGDLPPGWDVELYYNDVFVELQVANNEGRYRFENLPLNYGRNDFRLVFNGPLGQTRVETQSFDLSESFVPAGQFRYRVSEHRDDSGNARSTVNTDLGLTRHLTASTGFIRTPLNGKEAQYGYSSLRMFGSGWSGSLGSIDQLGQGHLSEVSARTRLSDTSVKLSHALLNNFDSEIYPANGDPVVRSSALRINGTMRLPGNWHLPFNIDSSNETRESGSRLDVHAARVSAYLWRTVVTNRLNWQETLGPTLASGSVTVSRLFRTLNFRSQLDYSIQPERQLTAYSINGSVPLANNYRITAGLSHEFLTPNTRYSAGFSKSSGQFGLAFNASYDDNDNYFVGAQFFVSLGPQPVLQRWMPDARPVANTGAALVRTFHDENNNGVRDDQEAGLSGIGLLVNGTRHPARSGPNGLVFIERLPPRRYAAITLDSGTLSDPLWLASHPGYRVLPRPGYSAELELPVILTSEIDGTIYLANAEGGRGVGDVQIELVDGRGEVIRSTKSAWDGFYILDQVPPGDYTLRLSPQQQARLNLKPQKGRQLTLSPGGQLISGEDFLLEPLMK